MSYFINLSVLRRNRNFTLLYIGQFVSFFGTMMTGVALPYQVYMETHSTLMVGLVSLAQLLPLIITALIGGVFADRYHRRLLLIVAESVLAVGSIILALNALAATPHLGIIFLVAGLMSAFNGLHRPALDSITQQLVVKKDFSTVSSLMSFKANVCMIAGTAVGVIIMLHLGMFDIYLADAATFIVSLGAILSMTHVPKPQVTADDSALTALKKGLQYAVSRQELMGTYLVDFVAMIFGMPTALFPAIAQSFGGAKVVGILYSAPAIGGLAMSFFSGWAENVKRHGMAISIAAALWGVAIICFGLSSNFILALFFLMLAGAFDTVSGIFRLTMWNETIPQALRGRMAGIEMISYLSGPKLGDTEAGLIAALFGVTVSIVSGGVLCVLGVAACGYFLPKFWRYRAE